MHPPAAPAIPVSAPAPAGGALVAGRGGAQPAGARRLTDGGPETARLPRAAGGCAGTLRADDRSGPGDKILAARRSRPMVGRDPFPTTPALQGAGINIPVTIVPQTITMTRIGGVAGDKTPTSIRSNP